MRKISWISSSGFPFVSGTSFQQKTKVSTQIPAYIQNAPLRPARSISGRNVNATMPLKVQFAIVPVAAALLRSWSG